MHQGTNFILMMNDYTCMLLLIYHTWLHRRCCQDLALLLHRCWLSEEKGTIWAFVAPMLLIILVSLFDYY